MPHYADGTKAEIGDEIEVASSWQKIRHAIVTAVCEGETCNLTVAHLSKHAPSSNPAALVIGPWVSTVTAKDCRKIT